MKDGNNIICSTSYLKYHKYPIMVQLLNIDDVFIIHIMDMKNEK